MLVYCIYGGGMPSVSAAEPLCPVAAYSILGLIVSSIAGYVHVSYFFCRERFLSSPPHTPPSSGRFGTGPHATQGHTHTLKQGHTLTQGLARPDRSRARAHRFEHRGLQMRRKYALTGETKACATRARPHTRTRTHARARADTKMLLVSMR